MDEEQELPEQPEDLDTNNEKYDFELSDIRVKLRDGTLMAVPCLLWLMKHLLKDKVARPAGDQ